MTDDEKILKLRAEAGVAGDIETVRLCNAALRGSRPERYAVLDHIADVEAEVEEDEEDTCD